MTARKATAHPLWKRWTAFRNQITNPNNYQYKYYGGRGLDIDPRWNDFWTFADEVEAEIGPIPFPGAQLDRIDNDRGYWPGNIQWSTIQENHNNRQSNMMVMYGDEIHSVADWARITGINASTLWSRIHDLGYPIEQALGFKK
jgi:hypothetical protein